MPVPDQRDPEVTRSALAGWLGKAPARRPDPLVDTPQTSGFSNETLMFDAEWTDGGETRREQFVARVAPSSYQVFPEPRFADEYRLMRVLDERTSVPVPPIRWYEPSADVLGAPFFVMGRIDGRVPTDMPPYHTGGWVTEVEPAERAAMWWSALEIMAALHRLDVQDLGLGFLDQPKWGAPGLDQRLNYYEHYLHWAYPGPQETALRALAWLKANRPEEPDEPVALWGDSRIGNVIFQAGVPKAVLDWETAALGAPRRTSPGSCSSTGTTATAWTRPGWTASVLRGHRPAVRGAARTPDAAHGVLRGPVRLQVRGDHGPDRAGDDRLRLDRRDVRLPYNNNCTRLLARVLEAGR